MIIAVRGATFSLTLRLHIAATALEREMSQSVADVLVSTLEQIGVKHIFGLIGDSLNPLADAVRRSKIEWGGFWPSEIHRAAAVCAGTTGPGSTHLVAGLYEATRDHAPVLALSGEMPRKLQGTEYNLRLPSRRCCARHHRYSRQAQSGAHRTR
jgi:thiamine pyrophosphate-dependent acetolactate synthase large subunit-like protein